MPNGYGETEYGSTAYGQLMVKTASATLTLEEKGKITVTVEDGTGSAISDVSVSISGLESKSVETDSNGQATFEDLAIGTYTIEASKDGYFSTETSVTESDFS